MVTKLSSGDLRRIIVSEVRSIERRKRLREAIDDDWQDSTQISSAIDELTKLIVDHFAGDNAVAYDDLRSAVSDAITKCVDDMATNFDWQGEPATHSHYRDDDQDDDDAWNRERMRN